MELINKILSTDIHEAVKVYDSELRKLGKELYNINCGSCGNRLIEIYLKLAKNGKELIKNKMERVAKLKEGKLLRVPQMGITWTNDSLDFTDEKALKVLEKYAGLAPNFEVLPEKPKSKAKPKVKKVEEKKVEVKEETKDSE